VDFMTGPFLLSISLFFITGIPFDFGSVRQTKLAIRPLLSAHRLNIVYRIV